MARSVRRPRSPLIADLFAQPSAYTLFQAIRLVEQAEAASARAEGRTPPDPVGRGIDPRRASISIRASIPLAFAAAEVTDLTRRTDGPPALTQAVAGLAGIAGVLPHTFTEMVQSSIRERELGLRAFLDLFNNRLVGLLYDAWAKHRLVIEHERRSLRGTRTPIDQIFGAVVGLGQPALRDRMAVPDATPIHFGGLLGRNVPSAQAVDQILSGALGYPIRVEQFHGAWLAIAPADQTRLPNATRPQGAYCRLGDDMVAGTRVWDLQSGVRLVVGPLRYRDFLAFLPEGPMQRRLADLATLILGPEIVVHTRLVLKPDEVPQARPGRDPRATPDGRLGLNTWLGWDGRRTRPGEVDLRPASPLASDTPQDRFPR